MTTRRRSPRGARPSGGPARRRGQRLAAASLGALAIGLCAGSAHAYPTAVVFSPTGEALGFGGFAVGLSTGIGLSPQPVHVSSVWGGVDVGVLPTIDIATTSAGKIAIAGAEVGFDVFGPDANGKPIVVFNAKLQLLQEAKYWPALSLGVLQASPDSKAGQMLGYFALSKSFQIGETKLGQVTFGMMRSFADEARIAPRCFVSGAQACVFRGSAPFLDGNGAFLAGYVSPWFGPVGFAVDYVGGTSPVSSTYAAINFLLWSGGPRGYLVASVGGFFSNDRRAGPEGPGVEDGAFAGISFGSSLGGLFGWDPVKDWSPKKKVRWREDPLDAPPITPPPATPTPSPAPPSSEPDMPPPG